MRPRRRRSGAVCGPEFSVCHGDAIGGRSRPKALPSPTESAAKSSARRFESRASTWVIARTSAGATTGAVIRHWLGLFEDRSGSSLVVLPSRSSVRSGHRARIEREEPAIAEGELIPGQDFEERVRQGEDHAVPLELAVDGLLQDVVASEIETEGGVCARPRSVGPFRSRRDRAGSLARS